MMPRLVIAAFIFLGCDQVSTPPEGGERIPASASESGTPRSSPSAAPAGSPVSSKRRVTFAVYTKSPTAPATSAKAKQLARAAFPDLKLSEDPKTSAPPAILILAPPINDFPLSDKALIARFAKGVDDIDAAMASKGVLMMDWGLDADPKYERLRKAQELAAVIAKDTSGFIWDELTRQLFAHDAFKKQRLDTWDSDLPDVKRHVTVHYYADGGRHRAVTLGLQKLGLPDLVVQDVPPMFVNGVVDIMSVTAQLLAEGASVGTGGKLVIDLAAIRHRGARERLMKSVIGDVPKKISIDLSIATPEEGDARNRLLEIGFSAHPGATLAERQGHAVEQLLGSKPDLVRNPPEDDPELAAIQKRVQGKLPAIAAAFRKGLPVGDKLSVKAPFNTDDGNVEWMWVVVTAWEAEVLRGNLANTPHSIKSLKLGAPVQVKQALIADYIWEKADGSTEGGESGRVLDGRQ